MVHIFKHKSVQALHSRKLTIFVDLHALLIPIEIDISFFVTLLLCTTVPYKVQYYM